jgi:hypothetical protein
MDPVNPASLLSVVMDPSADREARHEAAAAYRRWVDRGNVRATIDGRPIVDVLLVAFEPLPGARLYAVHVRGPSGADETWYDDDECAARRVFGVENPKRAP